MIAIKFCGLTTLQDCRDALQAGASWLGFNFYPPSPRAISPAACQRLVAELRAALGGWDAQVRLVGVFVGTPPAEILRTLDGCGLDLAQLSGDDALETARALQGRAYPTLRARSDAPLLAQLAALPARADPPAALVDAAAPGGFGGTGRLADWGQAAELAARRPIFLAGGLTAENVGAAVRAVRPWGVDAASGIESAPGHKDAEKMRRFVQAVRQAALEQEVQDGFTAGGSRNPTGA